MPADEGSRLHNEKRLLPTVDSSCEYDQEHAIALGTRGALHLTAKHDELLTEQGVFSDEIRLGAGQIGKRSCQERVSRWPHPPQQAVVHVTGPVLHWARERGKQTTHKDGAPSERGMGQNRKTG